MTLVRSLPSRQLEGALVARITNVLYISPRWGIWSLTTDELEKDIEVNDKFQKALLLIGASGGKDVAKSIHQVWKARTLASKSTVHLVANLVIWGTAYGLYREGVMLEEEWKRRHIRANSIIVVPEKQP